MTQVGRKKLRYIKRACVSPTEGAIWRGHSSASTTIRQQAVCRQIRSNNNNNNNNSHDNVYGAVIMTQSHCESLPGSSDECRLSAGWQPTPRPSQSTWAENPTKIGSYHPHPPSPLLLGPYYSARRLILILPSHEGWKAEST